MYQVKRFSGRASDNYRTVFESDSEEKARAKFNSLVEKMRQGGVMLVKDEITIDEVKAPNLRSRW